MFSILQVSFATNHIIKETHLAQMATVEQQRELMRYMRGLNGWLEQDTQDRQAELRGLNARVEELRSILLGKRILLLRLCRITNNQQRNINTRTATFWTDLPPAAYTFPSFYSSSCTCCSGVQ